MSAIPAGTVSLVFTDIQGSCDLWEQHRSAFQAVLEEHNRLMREVGARWNAYEVKTEGDAFFLAFHRASDALQFAVEAQLGILDHDWSSMIPGVPEIRVRIGIHTGEPVVGVHPDGSPDYFGPVVNRAVRVSDAGHGGQILLSDSTYALVRAAALPEIAFVDLGEHRLKGVGEERLWQITHPSLERTFPAVKTLDAARHNLPLQPTAFLGRDRELREIQEGLEKSRLVTLTGPGGTGKTRLSLRVAEEQTDSFPDGVFFVDLSALQQAEMVASTIAGVLGVREEGHRSILEALVEYLSGRRVLLVQDNFEHVIGAAPMVAELLSGCAGLKVLATSRLPLRLQWEQEYPVPTLALPDLENLPPVERLTQYEAVELFIQRAKAVSPRFAVTNQNAPAVAEICHRLDGLPLAIELAAARVRLFSPEALLARLGNRLKLLTGGARDRPLRQQTLRDAISWSYDLLEEPDQTLFRRMGVFVGGCTLEAAEAVCNPGCDLGIDVLDGVCSLTENSLLRREEKEGEPRFRMLDTLREYAGEKLEDSGESREVERRHAEVYLKLAEGAEPELRGPEQAKWLEALEKEHHNLRAAIEWGLENDVEKALRVGGSLWRFWRVRGHLTDGREWLRRALEMGDAGNSAIRAKALNGAGNLADSQGDFATARALYEQSLEMYRELGDKERIAYSLHSMGNISAMQEDYAAAQSYYEQSLATRRELSDRPGVATSLLNLGSISIHRGEYAAAQVLCEDSLAMFRELGDMGGIARSLNSLGSIAQEQGACAEALALYEEGLTILQNLGDRGGIACSLDGLAAAAMKTDPARAARLFAAAETVRASIGASVNPAAHAELRDYAAAVLAALGGEEFAIAWQDGREMSLERAVEYALQGDQGVL